MSLKLLRFQKFFEYLTNLCHFGGKGEKALGHLFILLSNTVNEIGGYYKADLSLFSNSYLGTGVPEVPQEKIITVKLARLGFT